MEKPSMCILLIEHTSFPIFSQWANFSGVTYSMTFRCLLVGCMYWPRVKQSTPTSRRSFIVWNEVCVSVSTHSCFCEEKSSKFFQDQKEPRCRTRVKNSEWQIQNWWVNFSDETNSVRLFHMDKFRCNSNITLDKFRWYFLIWTNLD